MTQQMTELMQWRESDVLKERGTNAKHWLLWLSRYYKQYDFDSFIIRLHIFNG